MMSVTVRIDEQVLYPQVEYDFGPPVSSDQHTAVFHP